MNSKKKVYILSKLFLLLAVIGFCVPIWGANAFQISDSLQEAGMDTSLWGIDFYAAIIEIIIGSVFLYKRMDFKKSQQALEAAVLLAGTVSLGIHIITAQCAGLPLLLLKPWLLINIGYGGAFLTFFLSLCYY